MFKSKTLLVLGAGASAELGLPTGDALRGLLERDLYLRFSAFDQISGSPLLAEALRRYAKNRGEDFNNYRSAAAACSAALPLAASIDNYLEAQASNRHAVVCGKFAIVDSILRAEGQCALRNSREREVPNLSGTSVVGSWLGPFFRKLVEGVPKEGIEALFENVSFVIFNYDRCVEHFLYHAISRYYAVDKERVSKLLNKVQFLHPYGQVGRLPWQDGSSTSIAFGDNATADDLGGLARGIRTFTEQFEDADFLQRLKSLTANAELIAYLGFAFHSQNMQLMELGTRGSTRRVFGSAMGISKSDRAVIASAVAESLGGMDPLDVELADLTCTRLFYEYSRSISS